MTLEVDSPDLIPRTGAVARLLLSRCPNGKRSEHQTSQRGSPDDARSRRPRGRADRDLSRGSSHDPEQAADRRYRGAPRSCGRRPHDGSAAGRRINRSASAWGAGIRPKGVRSRGRRGHGGERPYASSPQRGEDLPSEPRTEAVPPLQRQLRALRNRGGHWARDLRADRA